MQMQEAFLTSLFDPTNRMVSRVLDQEALAQRNQGQQQILQSSVATQALWHYDSQGRLVMRDPDEALAYAQAYNQLNAKVAPNQVATGPSQDTLLILQALQQLASQPKKAKKRNNKKP